MPSDFALKAMNTVHRVMLKVSFGHLGWEGSGMPVLELTTIGRKSGEQRTTLLTSPVQDGSTIVVVASRGGDDRNPAWFLNLRDNPAVDVVFKGQPKVAMTARVATAEERAELWPRIVADHANYAGYQTRTDREIPVVLLEPVT